MTRSASARVASRRSHICSICGKVGYGNGFETSHGRAHVRREEAVEMVKYQSIRIFLTPDDEERIQKFLGLGFRIES